MEEEEELIDSNGDLPLRKRFKYKNINTKSYYQEVKRVNFNNTNASYGGLQNVHVFSFHKKYSTELKTKYDKSEPYFDEWMTVLGKQGPELDASLFQQNNPRVISNVKEITEESSIST